MIIYTDGAASMKKDENGNYIRECGGWAFAEVNGGIATSWESGHEEETTNNRMELMAIKKAIDYFLKNCNAPHYSELVIYSDSAYAISCINVWAPAWENNGWTRGKKHEKIENLELIQDIYEKYNEYNIKFCKVKGHSNDLMNEFVDELAVTAKCNRQPIIR